MNLVKTIEAVENLKAQSEASLDNVPVYRLNGATAAQNGLKAQLAEDMKALEGMVGQSAGAIFVTGPAAEKFAAVAYKEGPAVILHADGLYEAIAAEWFPTVRVDAQFELDSINGFVNGLGKVLATIGVLHIMQPEYGKFLGRRINSLADAVGLTREIIRSVVGDELNAIYLQNQVTAKVLGRGWPMNIVPVVILNATSEETIALTTKLFNARNITHEATTEDIDTKDVLSVFKSLTKKLSPLKSKK